ncbi:helix-turn-helix domain-containing protein [Halostella sp. PRR32]|uniref:winged helix-turn-helix transcriptional regulator n=1 Tax=Halostella sp. PRR32 TaxID=3098147 RepID=UPI002B1DCEFA|nr:helix-turn-helix domain-containing protein [Halostella sp. PRR32]
MTEVKRDRQRVEPEEDHFSVEEKYLDVTEEAELFNLLGQAHMMRLIATFVRTADAWRFNELRDTLDISQNTLSARLDELVEEDFVTRQSYDEIPPRVEYVPTKKLMDFKSVIWGLSEWAEQYEM